MIPEKEGCVPRGGALRRLTIIQWFGFPVPGEGRGKAIDGVSRGVDLTGHVCDGEGSGERLAGSGFADQGDAGDR